MTYTPALRLARPLWLLCGETAAASLAWIGASLGATVAGADPPLAIAASIASALGVLAVLRATISTADAANKRLRSENERLAHENDHLRERLAAQEER